jgi:glycosyltransferase involved in cell wall biosynthesis
MRRRALVSQMRMPEVDRDRGSQRVDLLIRWLLDEGWSVTFIGTEEDSDPWQAHRLRQQGVATFAGCDEAEEVVLAGDFDLALLAFWQPASRLLGVVREGSPQTRVIVDSVDLHFLRDARRLLGAGALLDERFGGQVVGELNTYRGADAVLTVSAKEAELLADFLGAERIYDLPLAETLTRSSVPFGDRSGIFFVGNFRHLPNGEAVEYLCRDILPRLDPELLAAHPLSVVGSRLDEKVRAHARGLPAVKMVGWVPSILPYLERARVCAVPMLHGAGVKGKIVESLMVGTPVVTTSIGAEGMDLRHREHAVIADSPGDLAAGLAHLLTDAQEWQALADSGHDLAVASHDPARVRERFFEIVDEVLSLPPREGMAGGGMRRARRRELAYRDTVAAANETLSAITDPGSTVLVVSRGDDRLVAVEGRTGAHFPQAPDGRWAGYHPADSETAIRHLESLRERGAGYLAVPSTSFWWLHHYGELTEHLESRYRRIHSGEHLVVFDLGDTAQELPRATGDDTEPARVQVVGSYDSTRAGPPPSLVAELDRSGPFEVVQRWHPGAHDEPPCEAEPNADSDADWILSVNDRVVLPAGFLDGFLTTASQLAALGVDRAQPAHTSGPEGGPPVTERIPGVLAREVEAVTPLPVLAVRRGAATTGPTALIDATPIGLTAPIDGAGDPIAYSNVRDVFVGGDAGPERAVRRSQGTPSPLLSVLVATYDRPELLSGCLEGFCEQTLPVSDFEIVVVDDGSSGVETRAVLERFAARLPLRWVHVEHAGRAAAKNLAVLLARGDVVLFFDDDDVPAPELLAEHLRAHELHPDEATAILGHTSWAPGLEISPLMHYLTEVDKMLFAYGNLDEGQAYDWRCFWEGRVSSKRSLLLRHALHDQRLDYSIDVEMGWRLARHGLEVIYHPAAVSYMARPIDFDEFCRRYEAKGRAQAAIASLHADAEVVDYARLEGATERWAEARGGLGSLVARIRELEARLDDGVSDQADAELEELHRSYRSAFFAFNAKGITEALNGRPADQRATGVPAREPIAASRPAVADRTRLGSDDGGSADAPTLTVTIPVLSATPELAEMAVRTVDRVWEVARLATEVVVVDNGSAERRPLRARVHRFDENRGVATGWNTGIELARAPVVAVLNSDCLVEPGWDEALYEAATTGRRIAFPYTDHCDGRGFRQPDQAGTAGWCFVLTLDTYREVGPFDELFNPAYCEDTDYWHRAWELGIELTPVPDARVTHARRTSAGDSGHAEWLLTAHRYLYGWKHRVEPMRAPPYYNREIIEYHCAQRPVSGASTT